jgi:putative transposase
MHFKPGEFYHVYNRGNNKQVIFFCEKNYSFFLRKVRDQLVPVCDIVAYCLMPNHFHFLIKANNNGLKERNSFGGKPMQELAYRIGILLSSYSQAINKQRNTSGSLFQQRTNAKILNEMRSESQVSYFEQCFHYIHQNPLVAGLVKDISTWPYSSYLDYIGVRNETLCKKEAFFSTMRISAEEIMKRTLEKVDEKILEKIF